MIEHGAYPTPDLALADAWASIDGKLKEFREGWHAPSLDAEPGGHFGGYMVEAAEMIRRLEARGYTLTQVDVKKRAV